MSRREAALDFVCEDPEYLVITGSYLYGNATDSSDLDVRGFTIAPFEYLIGGFCNFQLKSKFPRHKDKIVFSFEEFVSLLLKGDPQSTESLWVPRDKIVHCTGVGWKIRSLRDQFISISFARRVKGYAYSEWRKVRGVTLEPIQRTRTQDEVIEMIRNQFGPPKHAMDQIIQLLYEHVPRKEVPARRKLGEKRKRQIEQFGYCTSSASHTIRLLGELIEFLTTRRLTFPRPNADFLLEVKQGKRSYEECEAVYEDLNGQAADLIETCDFPKRVNSKPLEEFFYTVMAEHLLSRDGRMYQYVDPERVFQKILLESEQDDAAYERANQLGAATAVMLEEQRETPNRRRDMPARDASE